MLTIWSVYLMMVVFGPTTQVSACESSSHVVWWADSVWILNTLRYVCTSVLCLGPVAMRLILLLDICEPAMSGLERLSPIWLLVETALASAIAVGRVNAYCTSWSAVIKADMQEPFCPACCCCSADFARPSTTRFLSSADSLHHWPGLYEPCKCFGLLFLELDYCHPCLYLYHCSHLSL